MTLAVLLSGLLLALAGVQEDARIEAVGEAMVEAVGNKQGVAVRDEAFAAAWRELVRLQTLERESGEAQALAARLLELSRRRSPAPEALLLEAQLGRWGSGEPGEAAVRLAKVPLRLLEPGACWFAVEVLPPGAVRVQALLRAMAATASLSNAQARLAFDVALEEALALRLNQGARPIQEVLHARFRAAWSGADLSLTHHRLGHAELADALMAEAIAREEAAGRPTADLWSRRGVAAFGNGDERAARSYLGRALAGGSMDGALMLGLIDLLDERLTAARMSFRTSILSPRPAAWALRGWGLTLLPAGSVPPEGSDL